MREVRSSVAMPDALKPVVFLGNTRRFLQQLPEPARKKMGFALHIVQSGKRPDNVKPLTGFSVQVQEIRIRYDTEAYRAVYTVALGNTVYLLHAFHKKSKAGISLPQRELEIIRQRLSEAVRMEAGQHG